jgi:D-alanine-D-alanine ligase
MSFSSPDNDNNQNALDWQPTLNRADFGRIAVLYGGWSPERDVSLQSGAAVLAALQSLHFDAHGLDVAKSTLYESLAQGQFDRAFIVLHGSGGEDGQVQALLELLGIPYTGSAVAASVLGMDKILSKKLWLHAGLPTPNFLEINNEEAMAQLVQALTEGTWRFPLMLKPAAQGSSIGVHKVYDHKQLALAWADAGQYGQVLAEEFIRGREVTVPWIHGRTLPSVWIEVKSDFYDYHAKYISESTTYHCPSGFSAATEAQLAALTQQAVAALGARGWARVDFIVDAEDKPWLIEINTVPGMTSHSLVPMAAKAQGWSFARLVYEILAGTL